MAFFEKTAVDLALRPPTLLKAMKLPKLRKVTDVFGKHHMDTDGYFMDKYR